MGNARSKKVSEPEKPEPPKPCIVPACGRPMFCQGYCDSHQHRAIVQTYGTNKNGLGFSKHSRSK